MKFAIITSGGKQYKVTEGETVRLEKLPAKEGAAVKLDKVNMIVDGAKILVGKPYLTGATVNGKLITQGKAKKVMVVKFHNKVRYRRTRGHRQRFSAVKIEKINA